MAGWYLLSLAVGSSFEAHGYCIRNGYLVSCGHGSAGKDGNAGYVDGV